MKKHIVYLILLFAFFFICACRKEAAPTQICLHDSSVDYLKRWANVSIQTDVRDANGVLKASTIIHPNGYFQINADFTYNLFSDDAPVNKKWNINKDCEFVLNPATNDERRFSVIQLSADSLTLRQTVGNITITQHYAAFTCPGLVSLQFRWDNVFTLQAPYSADTVFKAKYLKPVGYFRLNVDASYNVVSNNIPTDGTWGIAQPGCLLVLDKSKPNERSFDVQKLTADSLVIWRKDTVAKQNFLQHYSKHK